MNVMIPTLLAASSALAAVPDSARIVETARQFLQAAHTGTETRIRVHPPDARLRLARCDAELIAFLPPGARPYGNTNIGVRCTGSRPWTVYVNASVQAYREVLVTTRHLPRGSIVLDTDVQAMRRDIGVLAYGFFTDAADAVGMKTRRPIAAGEVLSPQSLFQPTVVRRGDTVTIVYRDPASGFEITASGVVEEEARIGQRIRVRNLSSGRQVEGVLTAPNRLEIQP